MHPAHLIAESDAVADAMTKRIEDAGVPIDLEDIQDVAKEDVIADREEALAKQLAEMRRRKRKLVDPLQFEMSIHDEDLANYVPTFGWETEPPSEKQVETLEKLGIFAGEIDSAGKAEKLLNQLDNRKQKGLTTPKQIHFLEQRGFKDVGTWDFEHARKLINRFAANGWRTPQGINPKEYKPEPTQFSGEIGWN